MESAVEEELDIVSPSIVDASYVSPSMETVVDPPCDVLVLLSGANRTRGGETLPEMLRLMDRSIFESFIYSKSVGISFFQLGLEQTLS